MKTPASSDAWEALKVVYHTSEVAIFIMYVHMPPSGLGKTNLKVHTGTRWCVIVSVLRGTVYIRIRTYDVNIHTQSPF